MKVYISYFYQIRNFTPNMLPLSTAMYPPKWFVKEGTKYWIDNNKCGNDCGFYPIGEDWFKWCPFMKIYYNHLREQNLIDILNRYENVIEHVFNKILNLNIDTIVLIVHEPPDRYCGERPVLKKYFADCGIELEEWRPNE